MSMTQILETVESFDGVLILAPDESSGAPEIAWGDYFFYYSPDGTVPQGAQPFATIVTKDYPEDARSGLDPEGRWRVNIHVGREVFHELTGQDTRSFTWSDYATADAFMPHPVYGALGWVSVVNAGERTMAKVQQLLRDGYQDARARADRRAATGSTGRSGE